MMDAACVSLHGLCDGFNGHLNTRLGYEASIEVVTSMQPDETKCHCREEKETEK